VSEAAEQLQSDLKQVSFSSEFFANYLQRETGQALVKSGELIESRSIFQINLSFDLPVEEFNSKLRAIRNREMARIIFRDQTRRADLIETTRDLSWLADKSLECALQFHYRNLIQSWGIPLDSSGAAQQLSVLALGKLGAFELNLSSDIDLIFMYGESGSLDNGKTYQEFFLKLCRQLIRSLDEPSSGGFVFRVDMRLRPYGESGALVMSRAGMEKYFIEQGREWERYAFIKARAAAGDIRLGESFILWLVPFVYRKHLDYGAVESLRDMKQLINQEVKRKSLELDVKLGSGGIREVEFIAQTQQLIWGGNRPELRQTRLLDVLDELEQGDYFPSEDVAQLRDAYIFLRNTEHAIQAEKDKQTQKLPEDELGKQRVSAAMGFTGYSEFLVVLETHRAHVSEIFADVMNASANERDDLLEGNLFWARIWQDPTSTEATEQLIAAGFTDPELVVGSLVMLRSDLLDLQEIAEGRLSKLMPVLLRLVSREEAPDKTFSRCLDVIEAIKRRSTYLAFLNENLDALQRMIRLFSMSSFVASKIQNFPILLYELTDWEVEQGIESKKLLEDRLSLELARLSEADLEGRMDVLRTFKHSNGLKIAMLELLDLLPTMKASDQLTAVAEIILDHAVKTAANHLLDRHGSPADEAGEPDEIRFGVVAYGKLGGFELGYGSDLDIVFLHGGFAGGSTLGERSIHNQVFYNRLGQRVIHILTSVTRFGSLYELDLRLRPDGNSGPLVVSVSGYERYLQESAWVWELQALVRARFVAGSSRLEDQFDLVRRQVLAGVRDVEFLREEVLKMRDKMRGHLDSPTQSDEVEEILLSGFDLKQSVGAIVDIEFLVQFLVLKHGASEAGLTKWTDKVRLLDSLVEHHLMEAEEASLLQEAYVAYRSAVHFSWLGGELGSYKKLASYREQVVPIWQRYLEV
jgi:glutamate-ammonia-ligase adenylyltransferase